MNLNSDKMILIGVFIILMAIISTVFTYNTNEIKSKEKVVLSALKSECNLDWKIYGGDLVPVLRCPENKQ